MTYLRIKRDVFQRVFIVIPLKFFSFFSSMDNYTEQFKSLKGSRTLQWKPHLGLVDLELELEDRTLSFTVTPARAATIMNFQQKRKLIIII
jgi:UV DNA damage repair endonuclease